MPGVHYFMNLQELMGLGLTQEQAIAELTKTPPVGVVVTGNAAAAAKKAQLAAIKTQNSTEPILIIAQGTDYTSTGIPISVLHLEDGRKVIVHQKNFNYAIDSGMWGFPDDGTETLLLDPKKNCFFDEEQKVWVVSNPANKGVKNPIKDYLPAS